MHADDGIYDQHKLESLQLIIEVVELFLVSSSSFVLPRPKDIKNDLFKVVTRVPTKSKISDNFSFFTLEANTIRET